MMIAIPFDDVLAIGIRMAPEWAEQAYLLVTMAREQAPPGEAEAWAATVAESFSRDIVAMIGKVATATGTTPEQAEQLQREIAAVVDRRCRELVAGSASQGGAA